jgi:hypothetical protein
MNMNPRNTVVNIPEAIAVLPLSLNEKVVLAEIARNPKCGNGALANLLGISERGVKKVVHRLRLAGHIQQLGNGRARQLHLTFHVEQGTEFPKPENSSKIPNQELCSELPQLAKPKQIATTAPQIPLDEYFEQTMRTMDMMTRWPNCCALTFVRLLEPLIQRVEIEMGDCPEKEAILFDLSVRQGAFIAMSMGAEFPRDVQRRLNERIGRATPAELIEIRQRTMGGRLKDKAPLMLAAWCSEEGAR